MTGNQDRPVDELDMAKLLSVLWQHRLVILLTMLAAVGGALLKTWRAKPLYGAQATILLPAGGGSQMSLIAAALGVNVGSEAGSPLRMYEVLLESRRARRYVAQRLGVPERLVRQMARIDIDIPTNTITLATRCPTPRQALRAAGLYISALRDLNRTLSLPLARTQADVLRQQLDAKSAELRRAEDALQRFQERAKTAPDLALGTDSTAPRGNRFAQQLRQAEVDLAATKIALTMARQQAEKLAQPGEKLPAELPPAADWRDKLANLEYDLKVEELTYGPDAPSVVKLKKQVEITRTALHQEVSRYLAAVREGLDPKLADLETQRVKLEAQTRALRRLAAEAPAEAVESARLTREVMALSVLVQQLRTQYQAALVQVSSDPNRWEVLDEPELLNNGRPVNKDPKRLAAVAMLAGLALGCVIAVMRSGAKAAMRQV